MLAAHECSVRELKEGGGAGSSSQNAYMPHHHNQGGIAPVRNAGDLAQRERDRDDDDEDLAAEEDGGKCLLACSLLQASS